MTGKKDADVLIIGAGAAGLAAAGKLVAAGLQVAILEARDRVGGRIYTLHDPLAEIPIELGAEFVHGKSPAIWDVIKAAQLPTHEVEGDRWCSREGRLTLCQKLEDRFDQVFEKMTKDRPDQSFLEFLKTEATDVPENIRKFALEYIEGFEAARPERIGVYALIRENKTSEKVEGDRVYRILTGYDQTLKALMLNLEAGRCQLHLNAVVSTVRWSGGRVEVQAGDQVFGAPRALITLPLSVLQAGAVRFEPELTMKKDALDHLEMGTVVRVTMRFRERFWEKIEVEGKSMGRLSFLHTDNPHFPTWWSSMPRMAPILTAWAGGPHALAWSGKSNEEILACATESLGSLLHVSTDELQKLTEATYFHNWQADPFSSGAYSYARVGGIGAAEQLGTPVDETLFFAGEATECNGRQGTVDGAIATGHRAAKEILEAR